jgi:hypothetical protein
MYLGMKNSIFWDIMSCSIAELLATCFLLVSCLAYSSTLKMEVTCSFEILVDFERTARCSIPEVRSLHNFCCENLRSYVPQYMYSYKQIYSVSLILCTERYTSFWMLKIGICAFVLPALSKCHMVLTVELSYSQNGYQIPHINNVLWCLEQKRIVYRNQRELFQFWSYCNRDENV